MPKLTIVTFTLQIMKSLTNFLFAVILSCSANMSVCSQPVAGKNIADDHLSKEFHTGRREALRKMMPNNSVAVIFSYPERVFSKDINYVYHPNPDLYYFSGYTEPNSVLLIFKDKQADGSNEVFFVQHRDPLREQWTGKRLGVNGVKSKLGFSTVYDSEAFLTTGIDFKKLDQIFYDEFPDEIADGPPGTLKGLLDAFKAKAAIKEVDKTLMTDLSKVVEAGNANNIDRLVNNYIKPKAFLPVYQQSSIIQQLLNKPDAEKLAQIKNEIKAQYTSLIGFAQFTSDLRSIKTPEEIALLKKSVLLSSLAHNEAMRAATPKVSERQLEGIMWYVHKFYGAEDEGYPPIVGSGGNGCILHYEENSATEVDNQLVLMDVGAMYHGYSADVTRTFPANGKFTPEQKAVYQLVYEAQEEVFKLCKEGVEYSELEAKTIDVLAAGLLKLGIIKNAADVRTYYPHSVSHYIGLDVHDKGNHSTLLKSGMAITVEPGIYIPAGSPCDKKWWNIGVRIEDDILIGKDGGTNLSAASPRKWRDIEKMMVEKSIFPKMPLIN